MITAPTMKEETYTGIPTGKILLWIILVSMIMMFAGLTSGYIVRQAEGNWYKFGLPALFYLSTAFIFISSFSMQYAVNAIKKNKFKETTTALIVTLGLGFAFSFTQFAAWSQLVQEGIFFVGNPSGSFLYVLTGLHLLHLVGGMIYLMMVTAGSIQGKYNRENYLPLQLCNTYWHFVDGLWIYLFVFLMIVR